MVTTHTHSKGQGQGQRPLVSKVRVETDGWKEAIALPAVLTWSVINVTNNSV